MGMSNTSAEMGVLQRLFEYSDWANQAVLSAADRLGDAALDREIDIGPTPGSLRRILIHTYNGELVWLQRWQKQLPPWPPERVQMPVGEIRKGFEQVARDRQAFISGLDGVRLGQVQQYRDSKGSMFEATLLDMILQGLTHSTHHRAQAANAIRRLGGEAPELDYMTRVRKLAM
jgi:uncharacterized damage-inducible protein DinB